MYCIVAVIVLAVAYYVIDLVLRSLKIGKITDKHVFITGCDSGFGHLCAVRLDKLGFHVFAGCLTQAGAKSLSDICSSRLTTVILDVGSTESIEQAVQVVQRKLPPDTGLWALINNAGIMGLVSPSEFNTRQDVQDVINVNLLGTIDATLRFLPLLRKSKGRIVNTSSIAGRVAHLLTPYTASKFGVEGFSDLMRLELRSQGIKVSILEPGVFRTGFVNINRVVENARKRYETIAPEVQAVYGGSAVVDKIRNNMVAGYTIGSRDLDLVVDAHVHAISARFPRARYAIGTDAKWFFIPVSFLPPFLSDFLIKRMVKYA
uniref:Uncharacterized protein n=1 Tax=Arion vulgaris TaxID=1028688 RepID=A0A0B6ZJ20_9EUPU